MPNRSRPPARPIAAIRGGVASWQGSRGQLTLRGVTRPVILDAEYLGYAEDPLGSHRAVLSASGTLNREDWGLTWNMPLPAGGLLVSAQMRIEIELEAMLQP